MFEQEMSLKVIALMMRLTTEVSRLPYSNREELEQIHSELTDCFICGLKTHTDMQEMKHGYWIDTTAYCGEFSCSVCKETYVTNKHKYCPNCGAKMDGGK